MQIKDKIISMEVIPSKKDTWFGEPYYEVETVNYTNNFDEWYEKMTLTDKTFASKHILARPEVIEFAKKFKHYATHTLFKANSTKLYECYRTPYLENDMEELLKTQPAEDEVLHSIYEGQSINEKFETFTFYKVSSAKLENTL